MARALRCVFQCGVAGRFPALAFNSAFRCVEVLPVVGVGGTVATRMAGQGRKSVAAQSHVATRQASGTATAAGHATSDTTPAVRPLRDLPTDDSEPVTFDAADLLCAARLLSHPRLRWVIATAAGAETADRDARDQCLAALVEGIQKQQGDEVARGIRLAMWLLAVGLEPAQPSDASC
jgi:hypothetical protein